MTPMPFALSLSMKAFRSASPRGKTFVLTESVSMVFGIYSPRQVSVCKYTRFAFNSFAYSMSGSRSSGFSALITRCVVSSAFLFQSWTHCLARS